jgi:hypothetical protein
MGAWAGEVGGVSTWGRLVKFLRVGPRSSGRRRQDFAMYWRARSFTLPRQEVSFGHCALDGHGVRDLTLHGSGGPHGLVTILKPVGGCLVGRKAGIGAHVQGR